MGRLVRTAVVALAVLALAGGADGAGRAPIVPDLTFYPQAGILWRDLHVNNFVDLEPGPGLRDFACGTQTYDRHTGAGLRRAPRRPLERCPFRHELDTQL